MTQVIVTSLTGIFDDDFDTFMRDLQLHVDRLHREQFGSEPTEKLEYSKGQKWIKIISRRRTTGGRRVYGFVATMDFATKQLGQVQRGDIHMAAGWSAPAKHKRGSIFEPDRLDCCGWSAVKYL